MIALTKALLLPVFMLMAVSDYGYEPQPTGCECVNHRISEIEFLYDISSTESDKYRFHAVEHCPIKTNENFALCGGVL